MNVLEVHLPEPIVRRIDEHKLLYAVAYIAIVLFTVILMFWAGGQRSSRPSSTETATNSVYTPPEYPLSERAQLAAAAAAKHPHIAPGTTVWPMHGRVTAEFGVPHRPWQSRHSGIDITSARPSGVTPVTVFRSGTVATATRAGGLGVHVIVDHGEGLTSVYAHLSRISVHPGQYVIPGDTIGFEGSTGASTGTHLHFEVRLNGQPVNPRQYQAGNP